MLSDRFCRFADYLPGGDLRFDNPVKHGASSLLLLMDVGMSRTPLVSYHLQVRAEVQSPGILLLFESALMLVPASADAAAARGVGITCLGQATSDSTAPLLLKAAPS